MGKTSDYRSKRKKDLLQRWEKLVALYRQTKNSPTIKCWLRFFFEVAKIVFAVWLEDYFNNH